MTIGADIAISAVWAVSLLGAGLTIKHWVDEVRRDLVKARRELTADLHALELKINSTASRSGVWDGDKK